MTRLVVEILDDEAHALDGTELVFGSNHVVVAQPRPRSGEPGTALGIPSARRRRSNRRLRGRAAHDPLGAEQDVDGLPLGQHLANRDEPTHLGDVRADAPLRDAEGSRVCAVLSAVELDADVRGGERLEVREDGDASGDRLAFPIRPVGEREHRSQRRSPDAASFPAVGAAEGDRGRRRDFGHGRERRVVRVRKPAPSAGAR